MIIKQRINYLVEVAENDKMTIFVPFVCMQLDDMTMPHQSPTETTRFSFPLHLPLALTYSISIKIR